MILRLSTFPNWSRTARYDIQATTPNGVPVTDETIRNLLRDRFVLRVKQERRDMAYPMMWFQMSYPNAAALLVGV